MGETMASARRVLDHCIADGGQLNIRIEELAAPNMYGARMQWRHGDEVFTALAWGRSQEEAVLGLGLMIPRIDGAPPWVRIPAIDD